MHKMHKKHNAYKGGIKYIDRKKTYTVPLIMCACVLKLEAEKNRCPVLVYVRSSDIVFNGSKSAL